MPLLTATFAGMCPVVLSPRPPPPRPERLVSPAPEPRDGALRTALIQAPGCLKIGVSRSWRQQVLQLLQGSQLSPAQSSAVACLFLRHPGPAGQLPPEAERQTVEIILNPDQLHHPFATQFAGLVVPLGITPTSGLFLLLTRPYSDCPFRGRPHSILERCLPQLSPLALVWAGRGLGCAGGPRCARPATAN